MSDIPTPETDAFIVQNTANEGPTGVKWRSHADRLEQERNEAREAWYQMQSSFERSRDEVERVIRERDEARFLLKQAQSALDTIHLEVGGWIKTMKEHTD